MAELLKEKTFPSQYPADAVKVLKTMSFTDSLKIVGSQALRSQLYAGDYDAYEVVEGTFPSDEAAAEHYAKAFQNIIRNLQSLENVYIGDIKAGLVEEWRVIPKKGTYSFRSAREKVEHLLQSKIITSKEAQTALSTLKARPTHLDTLKAREAIKFHILRWTPEDVLKGSLTLRDGRHYTLEKAFQDPTITKLDVIALIQKRYTELSVIYEFHNGSKVLNPDTIEPQQSLKESIQLYEAQKNLFKVVKRKFALAKLQNKLKDVKYYSDILNSDLGKLYVIYSDVKTLVELLEDTELPRPRLQAAISGFRQRLSHIYSLEEYLKTHKAILAKLEKATTLANPLSTLKEVEEALLKLLSSSTHLYDTPKPV
jgi:hypothetical protein